VIQGKWSVSLVAVKLGGCGCGCGWVVVVGLSIELERFYFSKKWIGTAKNGPRRRIEIKTSVIQVIACSDLVSSRLVSCSCVSPCSCTHCPSLTFAQPSSLSRKEFSVIMSGWASFAPQYKRVQSETRLTTDRLLLMSLTTTLHY